MKRSRKEVFTESSSSAPAPEEAPTLLELVSSHEYNGVNKTSLIPEFIHDYTAKTGDRVHEEIESETYGTVSSYPKGATVQSVGPTMHKYDEAQTEDPGALFSYSPPKLQGAYATSGETSLIPSLIALASKRMQEQHGAPITTYDDNLSKHSQKLAKKFVKTGLVTEQPATQENEHGFEQAKEYMSDSEFEHKIVSSDPRKMMRKKTLEGTATMRAMPEAPLGEALQEGREHLRNVLRGPKEAPVVPRIPQGVQEKLF